MSNYKHHITFAVFFSILVFLLLKNLNNIDFIQILTFIPIILIYSQLPDIDHRQSKIRKILNISLITFSIIMIFLFIFGGKLILLYISIASMIIYIFLYFLKHRGITHTFLFGIIISSPLIFFGIIYFFIGLLSFISHLIFDSY